MRRSLLVFPLAASLAAFSGQSSMAHCDEEELIQAEGCVVLGKVVVEDLEIAYPWARVMQPGQATGGGYVTITNRGETVDRLVHASSPRAARTEIHAMEIVDDVMTMRPIEGGLELPAGETVMLEPGGFHVMFIGVADRFEEGERIEVTFEFQEAGRVELFFDVRGMEYGRGHARMEEDEDGHTRHGTGDHGAHQH